MFNVPSYGHRSTMQFFSNVRERAPSVFDAVCALIVTALVIAMATLAVFFQQSAAFASQLIPVGSAPDWLSALTATWSCGAPAVLLVTGGLVAAVRLWCEDRQDIAVPIVVVTNAIAYGGTALARYYTLPNASVATLIPLGIAALALCGIPFVMLGREGAWRKYLDLHRPENVFEIFRVGACNRLIRRLGFVTAANLFVSFVSVSDGQPPWLVSMWPGLILGVAFVSLGAVLEAAAALAQPLSEIRGR